MSKKSCVVSVLNMKGGVGKTTLAANVFREVYRNHNLPTLLIDFDPQFNLSQMLLTRKKYEYLQEKGHTLFQIMEQSAPKSILDTSEKDILDPPNPNEISYNLRSIVGKPGIKLDLIAGDFRLVRYNLRENDGSLEASRERFNKFIGLAKKYYKIIVLDCNPSSSFLTRLAIESASNLLVPVRPDRYSTLGLEIINEFMDIIPTLKKKPELSILINDIQYYKGPGEVESQIRSDSTFGPSCLTARIPTSSLFQLKAHQVGFATDRKVAYWKHIEKCLRDVANEFVDKLGVIS